MNRQEIAARVAAAEGVSIEVILSRIAENERREQAKRRPVRIRKSDMTWPTMRTERQEECDL